MEFSRPSEDFETSSLAEKVEINRDQTHVNLARFFIGFMSRRYMTVMPWVVICSRPPPSVPPAKSCLRIPTGDEASLERAGSGAR